MYYLPSYIEIYIYTCRCLHIIFLSIEIDSI